MRKSNKIEGVIMLKKLIFLFVLIGIGSLFFANEAAAQDKETESAKIALNNYLQEQTTGDAEFIRKAFHKDARIMSFRDGKLANLSVEEFAKFFNGKQAKDEAERKRSIESVEISGTAAIAKIVLDYPTIKFTDYMTLLKIDGEWKIVNKAFFAEPRNNATGKVNFKSADEEKQAVETTLKTFLRATKIGNSELLKQTLLPEGNQKYVENNKYSSKTYPEFLIKFAEVRKGKPAADDADRKRTIESIEVSGNAAVAKIMADYPDVKYFEYLALLKIGDEWRIVNNIFYGEPKPPKQK
ncbi:MAG TPA: nuclear transport factor 2 family protein [Pyrinomonadaceae bacterium]